MRRIDDITRGGWMKTGRRAGQAGMDNGL